MTCRTLKITGAARCGKCGRDMAEMLPHHPLPSQREGVGCGNACSAGEVGQIRCGKTEAEMTTSLYRHFADNGSLLYVGISLSWPARTKAHASGSRWFDQVTKVEIEHFPTREAALDAEREAIKRERPAFNIVHNGRTATPRKMRKPAKSADPLLSAIEGPVAIVGPALVYQDDIISVFVAHGEPGTTGKLTEIVLGELAPDAPEWAHACDTVLTLSKINCLTKTQADEKRGEIVRKLKRHLQSVEVFNTDTALAIAYASRFPSEKSRKVLDDIAVEREMSLP